MLKCPKVSGHVHGNITWAREGDAAGTTASLPSGVEVRDGILYFLPVLTSHNGTYSCESTRENRTVRVDFRVSVFTGLCPPAAEEKRFPLGVIKSLPCKLEHVLQLDNTSNTRWLKDCHPVERVGEPARVINNNDMMLRKITLEDGGTYTCLVDVSIDGKNYTSARSIKLDIDDFTFPSEPKVIQQQEKVLAVNLGARVELKCLALVKPDKELLVFWMVNGTFADVDPELQESFLSIQKQNQTFGESTLTISRVLPRFLNVSIRCRIQNSQGAEDCFMLCLSPANQTWFHSGVAVGVASLLLFLLLVLLLSYFKVDVVLAYRKISGYFVIQQDADQIPYDALVSAVPASGTSWSTAADFALRTLPSQLEDRHGYRLFIAGRDDSPGEATQDAMAAAVRKCHRLIIVVASAEEDEARARQPFNLEERHLSYEQKLGLYDALTRNTPTVILVEIDGPVDYGHLPQSLGFIKRRQGALIWRKNNSNRVFWKKLRFLMPAQRRSRAHFGN
ncbi:interleukin-1 receptor type 1-like [Corythoichthys intestinalis]|uniref:interleukin-1 receptor type 1-like n=1 Tax=Corythoichthys intestinalis TaxID=161448 RepID=UPI0025A5B953|nr:interleukin-1 receptor type 1-like [Corythoichthys intestinalis]